MNKLIFSLILLSCFSVFADGTDRIECKTRMLDGSTITLYTHVNERLNLLREDLWSSVDENKNLYKIVSSSRYVGKREMGCGATDVYVYWIESTSKLDLSKKRLKYRCQYVGACT